MDACGDDTVIRAAYGIYYDQSALAPSEGLYFSPPYYDFHVLRRSAAIPVDAKRSLPKQLSISDSRIGVDDSA